MGRPPMRVASDDAPRTATERGARSGVKPAKRDMIWDDFLFLGMRPFILDRVSPHRNLASTDWTRPRPMPNWIKHTKEPLDDPDRIGRRRPRQPPPRHRRGWRDLLAHAVSGDDTVQHGARHARSGT